MERDCRLLHIAIPAACALPIFSVGCGLGGSLVSSCLGSIFMVVVLSVVVVVEVVVVVGGAAIKIT